MNKNILILSSQTQAFRGRELLKNKGIASKVIRTPANINITSCGFSLFVPNRVEEAIKILKQNRILVLGVFASDEK